MNSDWFETTLGEAVDVVNGGTPSTSNYEYWGGEIVWITTTELTAFDGGKVSSSKRRLTAEGLKNGPARLVRKGTTLVGTTATVGTCAIASCDLAFNQQISGLIPKTSELNDDFLFYLMQHKKAILEGLSAGTSFKRISTSVLKTIPLSYPSIPEQKRIVDLISSIDAYIGALRKQHASSKAARGAFLFKSLSTFKADWVEVRLGDCTKSAGGCAFPEAHQGFQEGIPFIKVSDMNVEGNEKYIYSANNYVSSAAIDKLRLRVWPQGTVVFPKVGAALLTEKRRILTTDTIFDNNLMGLVPSERILSEYLYLILLQIRFSDVVQPGVVPSIKNSIVEDMVVSIPPLEKQSQIVAEICSFDDFINRLDHNLKTMKALRSAVLTDLLGGFHTIPENYDNFMDENE